MVESLVRDIIGLFDSREPYEPSQLTPNDSVGANLVRQVRDGREREAALAKLRLIVKGRDKAHRKWLGRNLGQSEATFNLPVEIAKHLAGEIRSFGIEFRVAQRVTTEAALAEAQGYLNSALLEYARLHAGKNDVVVVHAARRARALLQEWSQQFPDETTLAYREHDKANPPTPWFQQQLDRAKRHPVVALLSAVLLALAAAAGGKQSLETLRGSNTAPKPAVEANAGDSRSAKLPDNTHTDRPYVILKEIVLLGEIEDGKSIQGLVTLVNSGRRPVADMEACATMVLRPNSHLMTDDAVCPQTDIPGPPPRGEHSRLVLGPETPAFIRTQNFSASPAAEVLGLLKAGGFNLYVYGDASYTDPEHPSVRHRLTFCGSYNPTYKAFDLCAKHNRID